MKEWGNEWQYLILHVCVCKPCSILHFNRHNQPTQVVHAVAVTALRMPSDILHFVI